MARNFRKHDNRDHILETALSLAETEGWGSLRLGAVADALRIPLTEVRRHYRDRDAIADAWFERAAAAMLARVRGDFRARPPKDRLLILFKAWFEAVGPRRRVTVEMLKTKLYASHPHHWVPIAFDLSRLIQWVRDAASLQADGWRRQIEEIGLTSIFLAALAVWANDATPGQKRTHEFLQRALGASDTGMARLFGARTKGGRRSR
jgi:AcrR family transcriptional regulator